MSVREVTEFDVLASDLPTGTTLLEASAGTGKTWTIGALVARYVAEGRARLDEMLVVTFGRAASQELRQRVRGQLDDLADALRATLRALDADGSDDDAGPRDGDRPDGADDADDPGAPAPNEVVAMLCTGPRPELVARLARVEDALAHFDAATIATIHQFCQQVLRSLGVAGDTDPAARLVEDVDDLLDEVVDDLYLRGFVDDERPSFSHAEARRLGRAAAYDPQATLVPEHPADGTPAARRVGFARAVRRELDHRKRRAGLLGYDDLLSQLASALAADDAPARLRMRGRWKVVLVDEFQDTDPVQWQVFDRAFTGVEGITMVLIGDPKQAIYAFRGGDVVTYLDAAATATTHQTLATNWRSDAGLVAAVQRVLEGAALGDDQIVVRPVHAHHQRSRLSGAPSDAPFRLRVVRRDHVSPGGSGRQKLWMAAVRPYVETDCARDVARLLASDAQFDGRPLRAGDVAVIAHGRRQLAAVQTALQALGVRAVFAGGGSVYGTPAAMEWLTLLEAVEAPYRSGRVRAAALTSFFPYDVEGLVAGSEAASDEVTDAVADTLRGWGDLLVRRGVAAVFEAAVRDGLFARVLATEGGERHLTDLRHLAESLHQTARGEGRGGAGGAAGEALGLVGLIAWLRAEMREEGAEGVSERTRRLDSDASAVQLVTIHGSKGLEYPVVYLPSLADRWVRDPDVPLFHLPPHATGTRSRAVDVGGRSGPHWRDSVAAHVAEDAGESLRLLYVALTRARSQVVTWWAPTTNTASSPLHRVLFGRTPGAADVPDPVDLPGDADAAARLARWAEGGGPVVEEAVPAPLLPAPAPPPPAALEVRRFERRVDTAWRRTSYSALASGGSGGGAHGLGAPVDLGVTSEPEVEPKTDEVDGAGSGVPDDLAPLADDVVSPMATLPVGATFGSLVHAVLEHVDLTSPDLVAELHAKIEEQRGWWPVDGLDADVLATALAAVATTPMGPLAGGRTLASIAASDLLEELDFELPLAGGDDAPRGSAADGAGVVLGDLGPVLRAHLPEGDPVRGYADALDADPLLAEQPLRGYLTGSVDAVLRLRGQGADGGDSYLVVDYKTNWLGPYAGAAAGEGAGAEEEGAGEGAGAEDEGAAVPLLHASAYRPEALAAAMRGSDYPLQALLYAVVAHRFLRWRLASYDPERHLGGVLYLYLRGMCGPTTPTVDGHPCGVFAWRPPVALVLAVSDLLDGEAPRRPGTTRAREGRR